MLEPVTLDQLRILMAIAETGSFSAAARRLSRAQSAISHAVLALETALGVALFDRTGRAPKLTEAGRVLLGDAKAVVSRTEELRARAQSMGQGIEPELSLAVDVMFPTDVIIESCARCNPPSPRYRSPCIPRVWIRSICGCAKERCSSASARRSSA
jgi:Transcriptional regulator